VRHFPSELPDQSQAARRPSDQGDRAAAAACVKVGGEAHAPEPRIPTERRCAEQKILLAVEKGKDHIALDCARLLQRACRLEQRGHGSTVVARARRVRHAVVVGGQKHGAIALAPAQSGQHVADVTAAAQARRFRTGRHGLHLDVEPERSE
jgi:hypothetical protein